MDRHARRRAAPAADVVGEDQTGGPDIEERDLVAACVDDQHPLPRVVQGERALRGQVRPSGAATARREVPGRGKAAVGATREREHLVAVCVVGLDVHGRHSGVVLLGHGLPRSALDGVGPLSRGGRERYSGAANKRVVVTFRGAAGSRHPRAPVAMGSEAFERATSPGAEIDEAEAVAWLRRA